MRRFIFLLLFITLISFAFGESTYTITFQGRLIDIGGSPVNGTRYMGFKIYNNAEGTGNPILSWDADDGSIPPVNDHSFTVVCNNGNYAVELMIDASNDLLFTDDGINGLANAYVKVYVSETETNVYNENCAMSPLIHLTASPFAISARQIKGLHIERKADDLEIFY